jgi:hypothetical protein
VLVGCCGEVGEMRQRQRLFVWSRAGGSRFWAKVPKPSVRCSVSGVPCETAKRNDAGRWWVRVDDVEAAGGLRVRQREARGWGLSQKPKTERS